MGIASERIPLRYGVRSDLTPQLCAIYLWLDWQRWQLLGFLSLSLPPPPPFFFFFLVKHQTLSQHWCKTLQNWFSGAAYYICAVLLSHH